MAAGFGWDACNFFSWKPASVEAGSTHPVYGAALEQH